MQVNSRLPLPFLFCLKKKPVRILLTSGASCPDAVVENVIKKLVSFYKTSKTVNEIMAEFE